MDPKGFTPPYPGELVEALDARDGRGLAFKPAALPPDIDLSGSEIRLALSEADRALGRLDGAARGIDQPERLLSGLLKNEAVLSNAIEGTHTSLADLALFEASGGARRTADDQQVENYVRAYEHGREWVRELPVGNRLFAELHELLLRDMERPDLTPGRFRDCQAYIGRPSFEAARFVPPPELFVPELMENLGQYLATDTEVPLIKIAVAHYQFETIHPYRDGNGRLGRLLISLWLHRERILTAPMLFMSAYFERNRDAYYDALLRVSTEGAWKEWILFFLRGVATQSRDATSRTDKLVALRDEYKRRIAGKRVSQGVSVLIDELFRVPVLSVPIARELLGVTHKPARESLQRLIQANILDAESVTVRGTSYYLAGELLALTSRPLAAESRMTIGEIFASGRANVTLTTFEQPVLAVPPIDDAPE